MRRWRDSHALGDEKVTLNINVNLERHFFFSRRLRDVNVGRTTRRNQTRLSRVPPLFVARAQAIFRTPNKLPIRLEPNPTANVAARMQRIACGESLASPEKREE
jgi:hypothetical protein